MFAKQKCYSCYCCCCFLYTTYHYLYVPLWWADFQGCFPVNIRSRCFLLYITLSWGLLQTQLKFKERGNVKYIHIYFNLQRMFTGNILVITPFSAIFRMFIFCAVSLRGRDFPFSSPCYYYFFLEVFYKRIKDIIRNVNTQVGDNGVLEAFLLLKVKLSFEPNIQNAFDSSSFDISHLLRGSPNA